MSRETAVFVLGVVVFFAPHLGVPQLWKTIGLSVVGVLLLLIGYSLRRRAYLNRIDRGNGERGTDSFVEATQHEFANEPQT